MLLSQRKGPLCRMGWIRTGLLLATASSLLPGARSWTTMPRCAALSLKKTTALAYHNNCDENDSSCLLDSLEQEVDPVRKEEIRMDLVRSLQNAFYSSPRTEDTATLQSSFGEAPQQQRSSSKNGLIEEGGIIPQLCLFSVPWAEVIGRTNVLFIHEPMYTNMMEELLRADPAQPRWFAHVPMSSRSSSAVQAWEDVSLSSSSEGAPSVLGTLMNITDFRRMRDGQLLLLVQALERLVVTKVHQTRPYGVAQVQLLPDIEELPLLPQHAAWTEATVRRARTRALEQAQQHWWPYEFSGPTLPLPKNSNRPLAWSEVIGSALAQVVPFAPLPRAPATRSVPVVDTAIDNDDSVDHSTTTLGGVPPLEVRLLEHGILSEENLDIPSSLRQIQSLGELELRLWLVLNDYFRQGGGAGAIPSHLLGWLPPAARLGGGLLAGIASVLERDGQLVAVSPDFPAARRQKRLSYAAAQLLERLDPEQVPALRQTLLQIPSTQLRLAYVIARWERLLRKSNV